MTWRINSVKRRRTLHTWAWLSGGIVEAGGEQLTAGHCPVADSWFGTYLYAAFIAPQLISSVGVATFGQAIAL